MTIEMALPRCSLKCLVTTITVGMGLITLLLALFTGDVYRDLTLRDDVRKTREDLRLRSQENMHRIKQHVLQLGVIISNRHDFQRHLAARDWQGLHALLHRQFSAPFFSSGVLDVAQINLYDTRLRLKSRANRPATGVPNAVHAECGPPVYARTASNAPAANIDHAVCLDRNRLYLTVTLPINAGSEPAYLEVLADLGYAMELLEEEIGMPLRLDAGEPPSTIYRSPRWPTEDKLENIMIVTFDSPATGTQPLLRLNAAHDHEYLFASLRKTGLIVAAGAGIITLAIMLLMLTVARRALLDPVRDIIAHMRNVRRDKAFLREPIAPRGIAEICELAGDFNTMSAELDRLYQTLETMASTDSLTRLGNRKQFYHNLSMLVGADVRRSAPFALLVMDLDRFKAINDTLGHQAGDQFLRQISERFAHTLRDTDRLVTPAGRDSHGIGDRYIARLGGDEFAVLLPKVDNETDAVTVAKKLLAVARSPFALKGTEVNVGISIGIALYPEHSADKDTLTHMADLAMYHAKRTGTGYAVYETGMESSIADKPHWGKARTVSAKH